MSKGLENFLPFIEAVSADYPWGDIKDGDGSGNGTDVNRENHADYHQTFRKILDKAYITPNGLPDNVTNGYQYIDALKFLYKNFRGVVPTSVGIILNKFYTRKIIYIDSATTLTGFIMPPSADLDDTDSITLVNKTNYEVVMQGDGTDTVDLLPSVSLLASGDFAELVLDKGNGNWVLVNYKITTPTGATSWAAVTPNTNWNIPNPYATLANVCEYRKNEHNEVVLRGLIKNNDTGATTTAFTLPVGFRPAHKKYMIAYSDYLATPVGVLINLNGAVTIQGITGNNLSISFDQIRFTLDA